MQYRYLCMYAEISVYSTGSRTAAVQLLNDYSAQELHELYYIIFSYLTIQLHPIYLDVTELNATSKYPPYTQEYLKSFFHWKQSPLKTLTCFTSLLLSSQQKHPPAWNSLPFYTADIFICAHRRSTCVTNHFNDGSVVLSMSVSHYSEPACSHEIQLSIMLLVASAHMFGNTNYEPVCWTPWRRLMNIVSDNQNAL